MLGSNLEFGLVFARVKGIKFLMENGLCMLWIELILMVLCLFDACRYAYFVDNAVIALRIAKRRMRMIWRPSYVIIVAKMGIHFLDAPYLFKTVIYSCIHLNYSQVGLNLS